MLNIYKNIDKFDNLKLKVILISVNKIGKI